MRNQVLTKILVIMTFCIILFPIIINAETLPIKSGQVWTGTYQCGQGQGLTSLQLNIDDVSTKSTTSSEGIKVYPVTAKYIFKSRFGSGSFVIKGAFSPKDLILNFVPHKWIQRPPRFGMAGLKGKVSASGREYLGQIDFNGCGKFQVSLNDKAYTNGNVARNTVSKNQQHNPYVASTNQPFFNRVKKQAQVKPKKINSKAPVRTDGTAIKELEPIRNRYKQAYSVRDLASAQKAIDEMNVVAEKYNDKMSLRHIASDKSRLDLITPTSNVKKVTPTQQSYSTKKVTKSISFDDFEKKLNNYTAEFNKRRLLELKEKSKQLDSTYNRDAKRKIIRSYDVKWNTDYENEWRGTTTNFLQEYQFFLNRLPIDTLEDVNKLRVAKGQIERVAFLLDSLNTAILLSAQTKNGKANALKEAYYSHIKPQIYTLKSEKVEQIQSKAKTIRLATRPTTEVIIGKLKAVGWSKSKMIRVMSNYYPYPEKKPTVLISAYENFLTQRDEIWNTLSEKSKEKIDAKTLSTALQKIASKRKKIAYLSENHDKYDLFDQQTIGYEKEYLPQPIRAAIGLVTKKEKFEIKQKEERELIALQARETKTRASRTKSTPIQFYGMTLGKTSKVNANKIFRSHLEATSNTKVSVFEQAYMGFIFGDKVRKSLVKTASIESYTTAIKGNVESVCYTHKAKTNNDRVHVECLFFRDDILEGFFYNLSQSNCQHACTFATDIVDYLVSYKFEKKADSSKKNTTSLKLQRSKEQINVKLWESLVTTRYVGSGTLEFKSYSQKGCVSVFPKDLETDLKKFQPTHNPLYNSTYGNSLTCF